MTDHRSAFVLALVLAPLSVGCADDVPPLPGDGTTTSDPDTTTGVTTLPVTTGGTMPMTGTTMVDDTDTTDPTTGSSTAPGTDSTTASDLDTSGDTTNGAETAESSGESSGSTTAGVMDDTIYEVQDGTIPTGASVDVQGVVVTAVHTNAFFAQEPGGGQYSGVYVYVDADPMLSVGDEVDIVGVTAEFNDLTEIDVVMGSVTPTGVTGVAIMPEVVPLADLTAATGEPWEGVFVRIEGMPLDVVDLPGFSEFDVSEGGPSTRIDNFLYSVFDFPMTYTNFGLGASFTAIQGPLNFTFGEYKIAPREAADLEGYMGGPPPMGTSVDDLVPGDLIITEIMFDPTCGGDNCEFIEIYNDSGVDVSLLGLRIQDSNFSVATQGVIAVDVPLLAGGYAVLGSDDVAAWPYAVPATAHYGANPPFNNTGDLAVILNSSTILDQTAIYPTFDAADNGRTWKLDPAMLDAMANDVAANWCYSTMVFDSPGMVDEYGTPGAANDAACAML